MAALQEMQEQVVAMQKMIADLQVKMLDEVANGTVKERAAVLDEKAVKTVEKEAKKAMAEATGGR